MQDPVPGSRTLESTATILWLAFITLACLRFLDPVQYGLMTWGLWLMTILVAATDLGLGQQTARRLAGHRDQAWRWFSNLFVARLALGTAVVLLAAGVASLLGSPRTRLVTSAGIYAVAMSLTVFLRVFFRVFDLPRYATSSLLAERLLVVTMGFVALVTTSSATGVVSGMAVGAVLTALLTLWLVAFRIAPIDLRVVSRTFLGEEIRQGAALGVLIVATVAYLRLGPIVLDAVAGPAEAGYLGAGLRVVEAAVLLPGVALSIWPTATSGPLRHVVARVGAASLFVMTCLAIGGEALMDFLVGDAAAWNGVGSVARILSLAVPGLALSTTLSARLLAAEGHAFLGRFMLLAALATAAVMVAGAMGFGAGGVAMCLVVSSTLVAGSLYRRAELLERSASTLAAEPEAHP